MSIYQSGVVSAVTRERPERKMHNNGKIKTRMMLPNPPFKTKFQNRFKWRVKLFPKNPGKKIKIKNIKIYDKNDYQKIIIYIIFLMILKSIKKTYFWQHFKEKKKKKSTKK